MRKHGLKLAVVSAMRANPDFSKLQLLNAPSEREARAFLRWLDQSGLTLYLFWQLRKNGVFETIPMWLRSHLRNAFASNCRRTKAMLSDFARVNEALRRRGIHHAFLKGFTLTPDFCPAPELRHQSDIDVLISPEAVEQTRSAILDIGYSLERKLQGGEIYFSTKLTRMPSADDNVYRVDYQKEIELHTSIWEEVAHVSLRFPGDCLDRTRERHLTGMTVASLSLDDAIIVQILHAFRHFLSSWVRLSWLWEIHYFLSHHAEDTLLWIAVRDGSRDDPSLRSAFGFILRLTNRLFASPIPQVLQEWCVDSLPNSINCWVVEFGIRWALSEIAGSKLSLFIHKEFVRDTGTWRSYLWRRLVPLAGKASLVKAGSSHAKMPIRFKISHRIFQATRFAFHAKSFVSLPYELWRWKRALHGLKTAAIAD